MNNRFFLFLALILSGVLFGCAAVPPPGATAMAQVKPFLAALDAYHRKTGDYPKQLDDLRPAYLETNIPSYNYKEPKIWFLDYQRISRNDYKLYLSSVPCSQAIFEDGRFVAGYGPNYTRTRPLQLRVAALPWCYISASQFRLTENFTRRKLSKVINARKGRGKYSYYDESQSIMHDRG